MVIKRLIPTVIFCFVLFTGFSQDYIILRDSSIVKAKIIDINENSINYTIFGDQKKQKLTLNKSNVLAIYFNDARQSSNQTNQYAARNFTSYINNLQATPPKENFLTKGGVTFNIGLAIPFGTIANESEYTFGTFGLFGSDAVYKQLGDAGTGYTLGIKGDAPVTNFGLGIFCGIDLIMNPLKKSIKTQYMNDFTAEVENNWSSSYVQSFNDKVYNEGYVINNIYFSVPIVAGLNYKYTVKENYTLFANAGIGCNIYTVSSLKGKATFTLDNKEYILQDFYKWNQVDITFAFKGGLGIQLFKRYIVDIEYIMLGEGQLNYKYSRTIPASGAQRPVSGTSKIKANYLTFSIGYRLK